MLLRELRQLISDEIKKQNLSEAAGTGSPTYPGPYDALTGHGYGHLGNARTSGMEIPQKASFPYWEEGDTLRDVYPELYDDDQSSDNDFEVDRGTMQKLSNRMGMNYKEKDQLQQKMNVRDRSSFIGADTRLDLAHYDPRIAVGGDLTLERIYTPSARSSPDAPAVSGTTRGWSGAPVTDVNDDDQDMNMSIEDVLADPNNPVKKHSREAKRIESK